jgi:hypothetical protein
MPHSSLKGSNASFTAPGLGVITTLPFDTIVVDNPDHIIAGPTIQFSYAMDVFVWVELLQIAGDNSITDATVYLYRGSTVVYQRTNTVTLKAAFTFTRLFFAHVTLPSEPITVRVSIVANKTLTFDMTNSKIWIAQLTSNPRFNVDTRL